MGSGFVGLLIKSVLLEELCAISRNLLALGGIGPAMSAKGERCQIMKNAENKKAWLIWVMKGRWSI
jgi:hypothetical protein